MYSFTQRLIDLKENNFRIDFNYSMCGFLLVKLNILKEDLYIINESVYKQKDWGIKHTMSGYYTFLK